MFLAASLSQPTCQLYQLFRAPSVASKWMGLFHCCFQFSVMSVCQSFHFHMWFIHRACAHVDIVLPSPLVPAGTRYQVQVPGTMLYLARALPGTSYQVQYLVRPTSSSVPDTSMVSGTSTAAAMACMERKQKYVFEFMKFWFSANQISMGTILNHFFKNISFSKLFLAGKIMWSSVATYATIIYKQNCMF